MNDDIESLKAALAKGPTPGPYTVWNNYYLYSPHHKNACPDGSVVAHVAPTLVTPAEECKANAQLFAACSPERISRLLHYVQQLEGRLVEQQERSDCYEAACAPIGAFLQGRGNLKGTGDWRVSLTGEELEAFRAVLEKYKGKTE